jgi:hypothetical protein
LAFAILGMVALTGCGPDNESDAQKLAKDAGSPGAANPNSKVETPPQPKSQLEHFQQTQQQQDKLKGAGYPGAKK